MKAGLGGADLTALLREVGDVLAGEGVRAEMYVVGGAALALAYDSRRLTRDVDAVFVPKMQVYRAAAAVATRHRDLGLPDDWLNDAVKGLLPPGYDQNQRVAFESPGLTVSVASPEHLLALKIAAARVARDADDILLLCDVIGVRSIEQALDIADTVMSGTGRLTARSAFFVTELLQEHLPRVAGSRRPAADDAAAAAEPETNGGPPPAPPPR